MNSKKRILICPLEWGLGHAGRVIPLALRLQEMGNQIVFGAGKDHLAFLSAELPSAETIEFKGFRPTYSRFLPQYLFLLLKSPSLLYHIIREHYELRKIVREKQIDIVISDNRFGLWNKKVRTVYITHQPQIPLPKALFFLETAGKKLHAAIIRKYDFCFIPDLPGDINLSGKLAHCVGLPGNVRFVGILSRFSSLMTSTVDANQDGEHYTVILSGPEPQKSILKEKLTSIFKRRDSSATFLEGKPAEGSVIRNDGNLTYISHLETVRFLDLIRAGGNIITRSGYTSIMELVSIGRNALLIPTPGQTEQEYLADYLSGKGWFTTMRQADLTEELRFPSISPGWPEDINIMSKQLLDQALKELLLIQ